MARRWFLFLLVLLMSIPLGAADRPSRILFIGNSYTGQVRSTFLSTSESAAPLIHFEFIAPGGYTLTRHLENEKTIERIKEGDWDLVVLQEQSQAPGLPGDIGDSFHQAAGELCKIIRDAGAEPVFYQTWGRKDGDSRNASIYPDYETMQEKLSDAYAKAARRNKAKIAPIGEAWKMVREKHPELGDKLYKADGSHPSVYGAYLMTVVFLQEILGGDPMLMGAPKELTPNEVGQIVAVLKQL